MKRNFCILLTAAGLFFLSSCTVEKPVVGEEILKAFYEAYEVGDYGVAMAVIPSEILSALPYEEKEPPQTLYERDESVYSDIVMGASGGKEVTEIDGNNSRLNYYLGVVHYWMGDLIKAKYSFLTCLRLDPSYRMAHIYLFRIFRRLEENLMQNTTGEIASIGQLYIDKLGYGTSDLHYDLATGMLGEGEQSHVPVINASFTYDDGAIKDFEVEEDTDINPDQRGVLNKELDGTDLYRIELIGADRYVLDEAFFPPHQILYWDGVDDSGKMTGGREIQKTFFWESPLIKLADAERIVIYDQAGKKILEHSLL
jgi:hypothetical protein